MAKAVLQSNLDFVFTPNGFIVDMAENELTGTALKWKERFDADRYAAFYQLGFSEKEDWFTPTMLFLYRISEAFLQKLTHLPELEHSSFSKSFARPSMKKGNGCWFLLNSGK